MKPVEQRSAAEQEAYFESLRVMVKRGGFSMVPPLRWHVSQERTPQGYPVLQVGGSKLFPANIRVSHVDLDVGLDEYVKRERNVLKQRLELFAEGESTSFETKSGIRGTRFWIERDENLRDEKGMYPVRVRQWFYYCENGNRKYVIIAIVGADEVTELEPAVDSCVKMFRFEESAG